MKKLLIFFLIFVPSFLQGEVKARNDDLSARFKKWLNEEVVYIIAPMEKEVFLKLRTDRERELFIEAFWKHRDPTPGTPQNEFKTEHYRRLNYVNHFLGRGTPKPGWKTDQGRMYIILGEPNDIERFEGKSTTYPVEIWFYQGKTELGLPPGFNLVFFRKGGIGEFKLYSPLQDGPQALMTAYYGDTVDYLEAYRQLSQLEPQLARVSLSLIPGEQSGQYMRPSLSSDLLIQKVETVPVRQVKERYAQKFLEYKDKVEVEYSANYMTSDSLVRVIRDPSGIYFVHYAIEPERLSVNQYKNKYTTNLKLNGTVSDSEGQNIYQFEKEFPLEFDEEQMIGASHRPLSIQDMFPLIPGNYKLSVLVKNEVSKEFTSLERDLLIPQDQTYLQMSSLILGFKMEEQEGGQRRLKPFQMGRYRIDFQANRVFLAQDDLVVAFQIFGLNRQLKEKTELKFTFIKNNEIFRSFSKKTSEYKELQNFVEIFPLKEFLPAHYRLQVILFVEGQEMLSDSEGFDITHLETIARPWVCSRILPGTDDPIYSFIIGTQLFKAGRIAEARNHLEKAFKSKPDSVHYALNLAQAYMAMAEYEKVVSILLPFLNQPKAPAYEVFSLVGRAYKNLGELSKAIEVFNEAISRYGLNITLLNVMGECYFRLGNTEEAQAAWEKSLEINPNQPQIRKNVESLKKNE
jgi:GWxTD domain-containing protein